MLLQFFIHHGAAAVFYDDNFPVKTLNIWKRLYQDFRLLHDALI